MRFPEFSGEWENTSLGEIGKTFNGLIGKSGSDFGQGFPYITYKSIFDDSKIDISRVEYVEISDVERKKKTQNNVQYGDVFFTTSSETPDEVGMSSVLLDEVKDCYLNSFCFGYRLNSLSKTIPEYMRFYLRSQTIRKKMFVFAQGSTRFNISKSEVMGMSISIPEIEEQKKIAKLLNLIDERIATQNKIIEDLQSLIKGLRHKLFESIIGDVTTLSEIANIYQPQTISSIELTEIGYNVYGANGIIGKYHSYNHENEQVCITCRGNTCGTVNYTLPKSWITGNAMVINSDEYSSIIDKRYLYHYLCSMNFSSIISGSGQPQIVRSPLEKLRIVLPTMRVQQKVALCLDSILHKTRTEKAIVMYLEEQRQHLLRQMFI